jgi:surfeit locus 1 family protein
MRIRLLPGFTLFSLIMLGVLIGLGAWQLQRLQWKLALLAQMQSHLSAAPIPAAEGVHLAAAEMQYRHVELNGHFDNSHESFVYASGPGGTPGYHVLVPFQTDDGLWFLVDRGYVPPQLQQPSTRRQGLIAGETRITGVWRIPDSPGLFTPPPDLIHHIWYSRNVASIAKACGRSFAAPVVVEADAAPVPGGWPRGGQTVVTLKNDHLQYAITWFLLAGAFAVFFFAYHRSRGRIEF